MKIEFNKWGKGEKTIFIASCLALLSFFLAWVDLGIVSASGFRQGGVLFFALYLYPLITVLKGGTMNRTVGIACGCFALLFSVSYISSKSFELFGSEGNAAGTGAWLFLLSSAALTYGVWKCDIRRE